MKIIRMINNKIKGRNKSKNPGQNQFKFIKKRK